VVAGVKPRLLDLFCGAGGASMGYHRAGFEVVGVDIKPQPNYPFPFIQADALDFLIDYMYARTDLVDPPDTIHASPPCQRYSKMTGRWTGASKFHPDLVGITRELLESTGLPYIIENVEGAPLRQPITLCGRSFGLSIRRHRLFELSDFDIPLIPPCACGGSPALQVNGHPGGSSTRDPKARFGGTEEWKTGLGIDWMTGAEMAEAIPPAYTEFIGEHLLEYLGRYTETLKLNYDG
jgi:DNA (cytosine-5)-methyltransferase 1